MKPRGLSRSRRRFLHSGAIAAGGLIVAACGKEGVEFTDIRKGTVQAQDAPKVEDASKLVYGALLCGGRQVNAETGEERFVFTQLSIDQTIKDKGAAQKLITDIGFLAHGVIKNPNAPHKVLVFEKKGTGGAEIDLKENKIINRIQPAKGHAFYGHGGYSHDGKLVYATEYDEETYVGKMSVRDATDFKVTGDFPTHGEWPHDCQFIDDGKIVAITNGGGRLEGGAAPNVSYVEVATGKLLEQITFDNEFINAGHLLISSRGDLAVAHAMREGLDIHQSLGGLSLRPKAGTFRSMIVPADVTGAMKGETLSLCMHEDSKVVAATNPYGKDGGLVTFWNYETQRYVARLAVEQPRGVALTLDKKFWVISIGKEKPGVIMVSTATHEPGEEPIVFVASSQGSHMYVHDYYAA